MAVTWKKIAYEDDVITKATMTAKGDLITSSAASTPAVLAIGTDGYILSVATDTPGWIDPATLSVALHAATHKSGQADAILLHEFGAPTGAVDCNGQQFTDLVLHTSADAPAAPVLGKIYYDTDTYLYVCTSAA
jgi:hypothetical protein